MSKACSGLSSLQEVPQGDWYGPCCAKEEQAAGKRGKGGARTSTAAPVPVAAAPAGKGKARRVLVQQQPQEEDEEEEAAEGDSAAQQLTEEALAGMKVAELKAACEARALPSAGTKQALLDRLREHAQAQAASTGSGRGKGKAAGKGRR